VLGRYKGEVDRVAEPVARVLLGARVRPNQLTVLGLCVSALSALAFASDRQRWGGVLLGLSGACDILDGALARASGQASPFGAFLDSVLDRYSDMLVLAGLIVLFGRVGRGVDVVATLAALVGTVMVSYTRARAESIGVECKVGVMERGERLLVLIAGALADLMVPAIWVVAVGANVTAAQRIFHTWRATRNIYR
jgi:CDP-diacylglycerol---glycerol-3-phosphate 3-phosphatidyltransferase